MTTFERSFEFGVIKALGTKKWQIKFLILAECFTLGLIGSFIGVILGFLLCFFLQKNGISYSGTEFSGISLTEPIKPIFRSYQWTILPLNLLIITTLSGAYPAFYTAKIKINDAMKKTL